LELPDWQPVLVAEYVGRSVIEPLVESATPRSRSGSDWIMRRGQFVHQQTGEIFRQH
jgi:hypothetical protein